MQPLTLALHGLRDTVAFGPCARKFAFVRNLQQRKPIDSRIIIRLGTRTWCRHRGQVDNLAGHGLNLLRIHEPIASYPHFVVGLGKLRQYVAPAIISDHDLHEFGRQVSRFRDHPNASFRPIRAADHAADGVFADANCFGRLLHIQHDL